MYRNTTLAGWQEAYRTATTNKQTRKCKNRGIRDVQDAGVEEGKATRAAGAQMQQK
jgi:hypothetical protein